MRAWALASALAGWAWSAPAAPPPALEVEMRAEYQAPEGWAVRRSSRAGDSTVTLTSGAHLLRVRLLGGKGSRHATPKDFLESFAAMSYGLPAKAAGTARVHGARRTVYTRSYMIHLGDPHVKQPAPPEAEERFVIVPGPEGRFFVLSYAWENDIPEPGDEGERVWRALLSSFKVRRAK